MDQPEQAALGCTLNQEKGPSPMPYEQLERSRTWAIQLQQVVAKFVGPNRLI
jgi:hypothetical protein